MKFYQFGNEKNPVIFLFPGTCCHWKINFKKHIPLLQEKFNVIAVSYDGFDETEDTIFVDMITETEKIEAYIKEQFKGNIFAAYGCSLGGSFVSLLVGRKNIHIEHAIIGSSDMDQNGKFIAKIETFIVVKLFYTLIQEGKIPKILQHRIDKAPPEKKEYYNCFMSIFTNNGEGLSFIKKESIRNQFYSDLITPVGEGIDVEGTTIHVFYATKMGKEYEKRYLKHFAKPDISRHDYEHEQLFFQYPEKWYQEILRVCEMK
ncbi:2-hydroxy-6-Oxo-6-Phenylhexa-2,4-Dienoate hydrolase [Anaeromyces robustus]|uniref:2-hydroxy-6-Oxo-6-Phenylhexa-2,4-Dienoate hydrolase n=1 Tax=Anaeromyces robustus TaxID=1754192 RepID=A0A1Y1XJE8_9FUNG|nr:2-hydroxy-6-Oxo-6-Phenylhexa-2,4-Dienoate hydrolase [Anaeromyces robustus]|eukprot:ORX85536.1 2-hydroxy-6-Oxo-6-Phenylhexa-2,4-Dienoate hydrolase [Anaeromyces robustus]